MINCSVVMWVSKEASHWEVIPPPGALLVYPYRRMTKCSLACRRERALLKRLKTPLEE